MKFQSLLTPAFIASFLPSTFATVIRFCNGGEQDASNNIGCVEQDIDWGKCHLIPEADAKGDVGSSVWVDPYNADPLPISCKSYVTDDCSNPTNFRAMRAEFDMRNVAAVALEPRKIAVFDKTKTHRSYRCDLHKAEPESAS